MKKSDLLKKLFYMAIIVAVSITSCSKERVEDEIDEDTVDEYSSMDDLYDENKQEEQEFVIDTAGTEPIKGKMGTKLYVSKDIFMFADGSDIDWPYTIKLIEIYPVKDIIFWNIPTISAGNILESAAQIRVKAYKDNQELVLKPGRKYYAELDTMQNLTSNMEVYYGYESGAIIDWTNDVTATPSTIVTTDTLSAVVTNAYFHAMSIAQMGWVDCAKLYSSSASNTTISFTAEGSNTENIDIFLVFKNFNSVMQHYSLTSGNIPVGEVVTVIAMTMNQDGKYLLFNKDITVSASLVTELEFVTVTKASLLSTLDGL